MTQLSKEAVIVRSALEAKGLETPMLHSSVSAHEKKQQIEHHMTPHRIAKMYVDELFAGLDYSSFPKITLIENKMGTDEMIKVQDIGVTSTCEHHFVTIDGKATVAYIPKDKIIGLSKINRIVNFFAKRPQVQERLTQQILVAIQVLLGTDNVAITMTATHYCVKSRGVMDASSQTTTTALGGVFKSSAATRHEFLYRA